MLYSHILLDIFTLVLSFKTSVICMVHIYGHQLVVYVVDSYITSCSLQYSAQVCMFIRPWSKHFFFLLFLLAVCWKHCFKKMTILRSMFCTVYWQRGSMLTAIIDFWETLLHLHKWLFLYSHSKLSIHVLVREKLLLYLWRSKYNTCFLFSLQPCEMMRWRESVD